MNDTKKDNNSRKTWIQYGIIGAIALTLYITGLHTEVIAFAQRGLLATGIMNPDVEEVAVNRNMEGRDSTQVSPDLVKADFNFDLINEQGKMISLADLKGKVIFINMWATWCPPCIAEMPSIDRLHEELGDEVAFVMVSLDQDFEKAKAFNKNRGYNLPIYAPGNNPPAMYQSTTIPTTYVIGADGNLALIHKGMADYSTSDFKEFLISLK
ncbi:TlpA family protein disulfide reductase [Nonlabens antarcticus]|uniref:TlpA family protein disulfide reductase n=1 Tax=Nonlabens antarcticus TaxID=392714 RepID=UPI001891C8F2|nr:TlpA disulfide reductase family protein [Nonlabens antarcticus]